MEQKKDPLNEGSFICAREPPSASEILRQNPTENSQLEWPTAVKSDSETHGGEDVALMASGPWVKTPEK